MAASARLRLESLLHARRLGGTLVTASLATAGIGRPLSTGLPVLDARLGGGWPRGEVSEVVGPRSSGRTWLVMQALSAATRAGELVALVDATDSLDPASLGSVPVAWSRVLWVRGTAAAEGGEGGASAGRGPGLAIEHALDRAVKAAALVLQAGGFGLVVLDLADVSIAAVRRLPFTTWLRLARFVEGRETACVVMGGEPRARSARGVSLRLSAGGTGHGTGRWVGDHGCARRLAGLVVSARLADLRGAIAGPGDVVLQADGLAS